MERDVCENRHGGNPESIEAFHTTPSETRERQRKAIRKMALAACSYGITTDEIAQHLSVPPNSVSGRLSEMKRDGLLVETAHRRKTRMGKMARVLIASEYAV